MAELVIQALLVTAVEIDLFPAVRAQAALDGLAAGSKIKVSHHDDPYRETRRQGEVPSRLGPERKYVSRPAVRAQAALDGLAAGSKINGAEDHGPAVVPELIQISNCVGSYADARATAIYMRLATGREFAIARFSRSDFASYFYKLLTGNYTPVTSIFEAMPGSDLIDFDRSVLTYGTYRAWNGYFKGFGNLPEQYLDQFRDDGWSVI